MKLRYNANLAIIGYCDGTQELNASIAFTHSDYAILELFGGQLRLLKDPDRTKTQELPPEVSQTSPPPHQINEWKTSQPPPVTDPMLPAEHSINAAVRHWSHIESPCAPVCSASHPLRSTNTLRQNRFQSLTHNVDRPRDHFDILQQPTSTPYTAYPQWNFEATEQLQGSHLPAACENEHCPVTLTSHSYSLECAGSKRYHNNPSCGHRPGVYSPYCRDCVHRYWMRTHQV